MKHQLQTIRAGLETATCYTMLGVDAHSVQTALTALTQLEATAGEPVAKLHDDGYWTPMKTDAGRALNERLMRAGSPSIEVYTAAPPAHQPQYEAGDIASASAQGFRDGVASVAQQPQARPDFNDEWTGYLKDGETPFERFLRERKDLNALTKLYQRALEENERLKAQQPQAEAVPPGFKLLKDSTHDERSWPEDYSHENGCYSNTCVNCLRNFTGYKRRAVCKVCDAAIAQQKGGVA